MEVIPLILLSALCSLFYYLKDCTFYTTDYQSYRLRHPILYLFET